MNAYKAFFIAATLLSASTTARASQNVQIGVYRPSEGNWYVDSNGNNRWDGVQNGDNIFIWGGGSGDWPVVLAGATTGNCSKARIAVVAPGGEWWVDINDGTPVPFQFGTHNPIPVPLPFQPGVTPPSPMNQAFAYDNGTWECQTQICNIPGPFGSPGDLPLFGVWNPQASQFKAIGTWSPSRHSFFLDFNADSQWDSGDVTYDKFGQSGDLPITGDFNSGHAGDEIGVFRKGEWLLDLNGDGVLDNGDLTIPNFGQAGDIPVVAPRWAAICIQ